MDDAEKRKRRAQEQIERRCLQTAINQLGDERTP